MNWTVAALVLLTVVLANLPFVSERVFLVWRIKAGAKPVLWRVAELIVYYF